MGQVGPQGPETWGNVSQAQLDESAKFLRQLVFYRLIDLDLLS